MPTFNDPTLPLGTTHDDDGGVHVEEPRANPLTYAALALSLIALVLAVIAMTRSDSGPSVINVGDRECVTETVEGTERLFCETEE